MGAGSSAGALAAFSKNCLLTPCVRVWQDGGAMNESDKQFSLTRAALSTGGRAKDQIPILIS